MKKIYLLLILFCFNYLSAQVGVNTESPKAILQIDSEDSEAPESTAGLGVPVLDQFPETDPTETQNGMLIFLQNTTDSNLEGFYYWDARESNWVNIADAKSIGLDISKTVVYGTAFYPTNLNGNGAQKRSVPFTVINSLNPSFTIDSGALKVGETGTYYITFSGGVFKNTADVVVNYTTEILVNGVANSSLTSSSSVPGDANRYTNFYISGVVDLNKDDLITITTSKTSTSAANSVVEFPYLLTLINLQ